MITIKIGSDERALNDLDESWINQQINRRKRDGIVICVQVIVKTGDIDMMLSTPSCPRGVGRKPYPKEKEIFDLWDKRGLNKSDFTGGNLIAFLKQLGKIL